MQDKFLINRKTSSGVVMIILGLFTAVLGVASFNNYSVTCFVNPGGFPCTTSYQVPLLAPLYPLSAWLMVLGSLLAILGSLFITLPQTGRGRRTRQIENRPKA